MIKNSYTDLKLIIVLTFLSVVLLFIPILNQYPLNMVSYALLLLFLPGYSLLATIKPRVNEMAVEKSIIFSIGLGVVLIVVVYSLWTYLPIVTYLSPLLQYLNPLEDYISSLEAYMPLALILSTILILDLALIAWARRKSLDSPETPEVKERYIWCEECKGYYKLEEDESPDDFETCQCGGRLIYAEKLEGDEELSFPSKQEVEPIAQKRFYSLDLLMVFIVSVICLGVFQLANQTDNQTIVEFLLILFLPGYALISMIYPSRRGLGALERIVYSFASSITLTAVTGIVLNFTPYSNLINPILYVLFSLTVVFLLLAYMRRGRLLKENRFSIGFGGVKGLWGGFSRETGTEKTLSLMLVISLVLMISTTFITANPMDDRYTNFTVLGSDGNPVESITLMSNEADNLIISIINEENKKTEYRLLVTSGGNVLMDQTLTLENEERKDIPYTFTVGDPGTREMEFKLYKLPDNENVYKSIVIPLTVNENPALFVEETPIAEQ